LDKLKKEKEELLEISIINDISVDEYIREVSQAKKALDGMIKAISVMK